MLALPDFAVWPEEPELGPDPCNHSERGRDFVLQLSERRQFRKLERPLDLQGRAAGPDSVLTCVVQQHFEPAASHQLSYLLRMDIAFQTSLR